MFILPLDILGTIDYNKDVIKRERTDGKRDIPKEQVATSSEALKDTKSKIKMKEVMNYGKQRTQHQNRGIEGTQGNASRTQGNDRGD